MLRDSLNLYLAIFMIHLTNVIFFFAMPLSPSSVLGFATDDPSLQLEDPVKTLVSSMAVVLTAGMTMRVILGVRSGLGRGGVYAGNSTGSGGSGGSGTGGSGSGLGGVRSARGPTYTLDEINLRAAAAAEQKPEAAWDGGEAKAVPAGLEEFNNRGAKLNAPVPGYGSEGVKITVDREVDYDGAPKFGRR